MIPAARWQAAIDILDEIQQGTAPEQALTRWARQSRFAGSKDRAAIRDHVFDVLRCKRSCAALGGADTGRGLVLGALRRAGVAPADVFSGRGHAPAPLTSVEEAAGRNPEPGAEQSDIPDWLWPDFQISIGPQAADVYAVLQQRAPVFLRVNLARGTIGDAQASLDRDGIGTSPHAHVPTALCVTDGARAISRSEAYKSGLVELQDASSQAVIQNLGLKPGMRVLDLCAGGGGKALAMAAHAGVEVWASDANVARMRDLPERAQRAKSQITLIEPDRINTAAPFDLVLVDAPCSGSGAWRRSPAGKWALTREKLDELVETQAGILKQAADYVADHGLLAYATCSMLNAENSEQVEHFTGDSSGWGVADQHHWFASSGGDGFYLALLTRDDARKYNPE